MSNNRSAVSTTLKDMRVPFVVIADLVLALVYTIYVSFYPLWESSTGSFPFLVNYPWVGTSDIGMAFVGSSLVFLVSLLLAAYFLSRAGEFETAKMPALSPSAETKISPEPPPIEDLEPASEVEAAFEGERGIDVYGYLLLAIGLGILAAAVILPYANNPPGVTVMLGGRDATDFSFVMTAISAGLGDLTIVAYLYLLCFIALPLMALLELLPFSRSRRMAGVNLVVCVLMIGLTLNFVLTGPSVVDASGQIIEMQSSIGPGSGAVIVFGLTMIGLTIFMLVKGLFNPEKVTFEET